MLSFGQRFKPPFRYQPTVTAWPWPEQVAKEVRDEHTERIVEWLRGRTGAHDGGFTSADDVADAIEREFGGSEPCRMTNGRCDARGSERP